MDKQLTNDDEQLTINFNLDIDKKGNLIINKPLLEKKIINRIKEIRIYTQNYQPPYVKEIKEIKEIKDFVQNILKKECFFNLNKILINFKNKKSKIYKIEFSIDFDIKELLDMKLFEFNRNSEKIIINSKSLKKDIRIINNDKEKITFEYTLINGFIIKENFKHLSCFLKSEFELESKPGLDEKEFPAKIDPTILDKNDLFVAHDLTLKATLPLSEKKNEYNFKLFLTQKNDDETKLNEKKHITDFTVVVYPKKERECNVELKEINEIKELSKNKEISIANLKIRKKQFNEEEFILLDREIKYQIELDRKAEDYFDVYFKDSSKEIKINTAEYQEISKEVKLKLKKLPKQEKGQVKIFIKEKENGKEIKRLELKYQIAKCQTSFEKLQNLDVLSKSQSILVGALKITKESNSADIIINREITYQIDLNNEAKNYFNVYFEDRSKEIKINTAKCEGISKEVKLKLENLPSEDFNSLNILVKENEKEINSSPISVHIQDLEAELNIEKEISIKKEQVEKQDKYLIGDIEIDKSNNDYGKNSIVIVRDVIFKLEHNLTEKFDVFFDNNQNLISLNTNIKNKQIYEIYLKLIKDFYRENNLKIKLLKNKFYKNKEIKIKAPKLAELDFKIDQSETEVSGQVENLLIAKAIFKELKEYELGYFHQSYELSFELDIPEDFKEIVKVSFDNNKQDFAISTSEIEQESLEKGINLTVTENPKEDFILKIKVIAKNINNKNDKKEKEFNVKIKRKIEGPLTLNFYHKDEDIDILENDLIIEDNNDKKINVPEQKKYKNIQIILSTRDDVQQFLYLKFENNSGISNYKIEFDTDEQQCFILNKNIAIETKTEGNIAIFWIDPVCMFFDRKEVEIKDFTLKYTIYKNGKSILNNSLTFNLKFVPEYYCGEVFLDLGTSAIAILWTPKGESRQVILYSDKFFNKRKEDYKDQQKSLEMIEKEPLISSLMIVENTEKLNEIKEGEFPKKYIKERPFILSPYIEQVEQANIILPSVKVLISSNNIPQYITQKLKYEMLNGKLGHDLYKKLKESKLYLIEVLNQIFYYFIKFSLDEKSNQKFAIPEEFRQEFDLKNIQKLYFSVPNTFTEKIYNLIKENFEKIGIKKDNIYLVRESDSVAFTYYYHTDKSDVKNLLIYDIGAGTLDISYFEKTEKEIKLISRLGLNTGGNYIDYVIATILLELMGGEKMAVKFKNKDRKIVLLFKTVIKNIKENLSELQNKLIDYLQAEGEKGKQFKEFLEKTLELKNYETEDTLENIIKHEKYEQLLTHIVDDALNRFKNLTKQKLKKEIKPDLVLLSGRAAKLYGLKEKIKEYFKDIKVEFIYENEVIKHTFSKLFDNYKEKWDIDSLMLKYIVPYGSYAYSQLKKDSDDDLKKIELANYGFIYKPANSTKEEFKKIDILTEQKIEYKFEENIYREVKFVKTYSDDPTKDSDDLKYIFTNFLHDFVYEKGNIIKLEKKEDNIVEIDVSGKLNKFSLNDMQKNGAFNKSQWPFSFISDET